MTVTELPVLTVTGTCGTPTIYNIDGKLVAFICSHQADTAQHPGGIDSADTAQHPGEIDLSYEEGTSADSPKQGHGYTSHPDIFQGHSTRSAAAELVQTIGDLARQGLSDDHLLVLRPDGTVGADPDDYRDLLQAHQHRQGSEAWPVQIDLGDRVRSFLSYDVDETARPFVLVSPPSFGNISAHHLEPTLRRAASANAQVRLLTL